MSATRKRPGSRHYAKATEHLTFTTPDREEVGIDFVCQRGGHPIEVVGQFRMPTWDCAPELRVVEALKLPDGRLPVSTGGQAGVNQPLTKAVMVCTRCGHNKEISAARLREALDAIWKLDLHRRVVTKEI